MQLSSNCGEIKFHDSLSIWRRGEPCTVGSPYGEAAALKVAAAAVPHLGGLERTPAEM